VGRQDSTTTIDETNPKNIIINNQNNIPTVYIDQTKINKKSL